MTCVSAVKHAVNAAKGAAEGAARGAFAKTTAKADPLCDSSVPVVDGNAIGGSDGAETPEALHGMEATAAGCVGVEVLDASQEVHGHLEYRRALPALLARLELEL
jgi:hypothetical protein